MHPLVSPIRSNCILEEGYYTVVNPDTYHVKQGRRLLSPRWSSGRRAHSSRTPLKERFCFKPSSVLFLPDTFFLHPPIELFLLPASQFTLVPTLFLFSSPVPELLLFPLTAQFLVLTFWQTAVAWFCLYNKVWLDFFLKYN